VLWIRIGFNVDPDPAFYLNANPDPAFYLNADSDSDPDPQCGSMILKLKVTKVKFLHEKYTFK
jgi:hypothetical protein